MQDHQRARAVAAAVEIAHESGISKLTVAAACRVARMSKGTFYGLFGGSEAFVEYCFETTFARTTGTLREAIAQDEPCWRTKFDRAVAALVAAVSAEPLAAEFCLVHCFEAPERSRDHDFETLVFLLKTSLEEGRRESRPVTPHDRRGAPPVAEEYLARALASLVSQRLRAGEADRLREDRVDIVTMLSTILFGDRPGWSWPCPDSSQGEGAARESTTSRD